MNGIDKLPKGASANAYLAQLVVTRIIDSEKYFYAQGVHGIVKGDDRTEPGELLKPGENGFAYVMFPQGKPPEDIPDETPLILTPVSAGGFVPGFDPAPYKERCVAGRADGTGVIVPIDDQGYAVEKDGTLLFNDTRNPLSKHPKLTVIPPALPSES